MACLASRIVCRCRTGRHRALQSYSTESLKQLSSSAHCTSTSSSYAQEAASRLHELGLTPEDITSNPIISRQPFSLIEHRLNYFAEAGLKASASSLTNFDLLVKTSIPVLKEAELISSDVNVIDKLLSSINFDGPYPSHVDPDDIFESVHFQILTHCMQYNFGYSFPFWNRYIHACLKFSLSNIEQFKNIGLGWRWIRNHPTLICFANPYNLKRLFEVEKMYEVPTSLNALLRRDPYIAFVDSEDYRAIFFILMKRQICKHDVSSSKATEHFLIEPEILEAQLDRIKMPPDAMDTNLLSFLYKLKYLKPTRKDKSCENIQNLIGKQKSPFIKVPEVTPGSWQDEMNQWFASKKVQLEHKPCRHDPYANGDEGHDEEEEDNKHEDSLSGKKRGRLARYIAISLDLQQDFVENQLSLVPLGNRAPTIRATRTLKFLLDSGFKRKDISQVIQLLLYPRAEVKKALKQVLSHETYGSSKYRSRHLHLCLYHVLIKHNYRIYQS